MSSPRHRVPRVLLAVGLAAWTAAGIGSAAACGATTADACIVRGTLAFGCPELQDLRELKRLVGERLNTIPLMREKGCQLFRPGTLLKSGEGGTTGHDAWHLRPEESDTFYWMDASDFR